MDAEGISLNPSIHSKTSRERKSRNVESSLVSETNRSPSFRECV